MRKTTKMNHRIKTLKLRESCFALLFVITTGLAQAKTLEQTVYDALQTNPDVAGAVQTYYGSREDLDAATGNFLPRLDLTADTGKEDLDREGVGETNKTRTNAKLQLTVPLFRGFANSSELERADFGMQAAYYETLAQAENTALRITKAYLDVLNAQDVVRLSALNLEEHEKTFDLVEAKYKQGVANRADETQMKGRLSRVKANLLSSRNNLRDAEAVFTQLTGERASDLQRPEVDQRFLPESNQRALELALTNSQSLIASRLNTKAASASATGLNSHLYPDFDLVADRTWKEDVSGFDGQEDEWRVLVEMNWNLYSGGSSNAKQKKARYQEEAARMRSNRIYREIQANVDSSWDAYLTLHQTLVHLQDYVEQSKESAKLYGAQFKLGSRTLLDLLDAQNELFEARKQYLASDYQHVYAQYRVVASMSYILDAMQVNFMGALLDEQLDEQNEDEQQETDDEQEDATTDTTVTAEGEQQ
jgi:adhesin transport system outer membrane protein